MTCPAISSARDRIATPQICITVAASAIMQTACPTQAMIRKRMEPSGWRNALALRIWMSAKTVKTINAPASHSWATQNTVIVATAKIGKAYFCSRVSALAGTA